MILRVHGIVMESGVCWDRDLAFLVNLRGICEPFNFNRRIIGFDTFEGFPSVSQKDGSDPVLQIGAASVTEGYEEYLSHALNYHESESPIPHIKKFELLKGDAPIMLAGYLEKHPETIVALAYFDLDLCEPTKKCLELLCPHLTKGSVLIFDELCDPTWPGETLAVKEVFGLDRSLFGESLIIRRFRT